MKINLIKTLVISFVLFYLPLNIYANSQIVEPKNTQKAEALKEIENTEIPIKTTLTEQDLRIYNIIENSNFYNFYAKIPTYKKSTSEIDNVIFKNISVTFENNDVFNIYRMNFKENKNDRLKLDIPIKGNSIIVRYVDPETNEWVATTNPENLKFATLFIDTDTNSYVISVPAVYQNDFSNSTLTFIPEEELTPVLTKTNNTMYTLEVSFPQNPDFIGEYWMLESSEPLVNWNQEILDQLKRHDLAIERRWSYDGYYFKTPSNYNPSGENTLYKHTANYTGAYFIENPINNLFKDLGYVMTKVCMENQNEDGYWTTGPASEWLLTDFGIGANFYDTRFNTDFALSLLNGYKNYNDKDFLISAVLYAEFFLEFAKNNHYDIQGGGILVQDYGWYGENEATHVSLNHHIAELNFLLELYFITGEQSYLDFANEMLLGVENTRDRWILDDNNLNYALFYTKDTNPMVDYPYLTYNDLYETNVILKKLFNTGNETIIYLMNCKKQWMDNNGITGYKS